MLGRTYSIGYEPDLEHVLFERPVSRITDPALRWAVWYPLRRVPRSFATLPADEQRRILAEHGTLGHRYGSAGLALDVRLACHGLDRERQRLHHRAPRREPLPPLLHRPGDAR